MVASFEDGFQRGFGTGSNVFWDGGSSPSSPNRRERG